MPTKTKTKQVRRRTTGKLICPECGFKAAHPMGLGRHRSARHGVRSKREQALRARAGSPGRGGRREINALMKRLKELEERHDRLVAALFQATKGRSKPRA